MPPNILRIIVLTASLLSGAAFVGVLTLLLEGPVAKFMLDKGSSFFLYPFTVQNLMWLMFFVGAGELWLRLQSASEETEQIERRLLPEDESSMLRSQDLGTIYKQVNVDPKAKGCFLQRLISRTILQFQSSRSVNQANSLLNSSLELFQHEVELNYNMLRYIVWLIPTLGFIGTVIGIALALNVAGTMAKVDAQNEQIMVQVTESLGVAFYTTLLALLLSAVLMFFLHIAQAREERSLNKAGQYCLDNLINRLYEK